MTDNLESRPHYFKIVPVAGGLPAGVNFTLPASQFVYVDAPVKQWKFDKVGTDTYKLEIGGYGHVGVESGKIIASVHPEYSEEWKFIYHEYHDAYTIVLAKGGTRGWTVPPPLSDRHVVLLEPIVETGSIPPQYKLTQLFKLVSDD